MADIFRDGGELLDTAFWDKADDVISEVVIVRTGAGAYRVNFGGDGSITFPELSELYLQVSYYSTDVSGQWFKLRYNTTTILAFTIDAGSRLNKVYVGSTLVATGTHTIPNSQYVCFEVYFKMADAGGRITVKTDGNPDVDFTGDTKPGADTKVNNLNLIAVQVNAYFDDLAMNDTTGGVDNSWVGDERYEKIIPIGNGAHNNWHGSDGDDLNNWNLVDEYPKDDDTTYVYRAGADSGTQDQYDMSTTFSGTNKVITRVFAEARARKTAANANQIKLGILPSGGVDQMSAGKDVFVNLYRKVVGDDYLVNPVDGLVWEEADIDALEGIVQVA